MDKLTEIPIVKWQELPVNVYEKVLMEVKISFEDQISNTYTITDRSLKGLIFFLSFLSGIGLYYFKYHANICIVLFFCAASIINIFNLYSNIKGRNGVSPGMLPNHILTKDFDKDWDDEKKEKLLYKNLVEQYWNAANRMEDANKKRIHSYGASLKLTMIIIVASTLYLGFIMYHP